MTEPQVVRTIAEIDKLYGNARYLQHDAAYDPIDPQRLVSQAVINTLNWLFHEGAEAPIQSDDDGIWTRIGVEECPGRPFSRTIPE